MDGILIAAILIALVVAATRKGKPRRGRDTAHVGLLSQTLGNKILGRAEAAERWTPGTRDPWGRW